MVNEKKIAERLIRGRDVSDKAVADLLPESLVMPGYVERADTQDLTNYLLMHSKRELRAIASVINRFRELVELERTGR
jgi:hypothetical protein